jgi:capsular exopolysaccharide synthesis family protein
VSKLFDILSGGKGEIADLVRPLANPASAPAPQAAPAEPPARTAAPLPVAQAAALAAPPPAAPVSHSVRTASLRIPAPSPLLPFGEGQERASEQYRILRTKIVQHPRQPRVLVVSSPAAGDGKSVSAINIAAALSLKTDANVLLIDADLRRSAVHVQLGLPESPGLAEVLRGDCAAEDAIIRTQEFPHLFTLTAGSVDENPVELLDSAAWRALCAAMREKFRFVVIDSPPVGAVADYDLIQAVSEGVILVIRPDHTDRGLCKRALATIPKGKLLGVVLNCVPEWALSSHASSDYYYYGGGKAYTNSRNGAGRA